MKRSVFILLIALLLLLSTGYVSGDTDDNDSYGQAERINVDTFSGSLDNIADSDDWYIIEVPPYTDIKITVELIGTNLLAD